MKNEKLSKHGQEIEQALQEAVADAIEDHRRAGKPVRVDPNSVRTVREQRAEYGEEKRKKSK